MNVFKVLRKPVVTEKSTLLQDSRKYVFEIHPNATKSQVREAVERFVNEERREIEHEIDGLMDYSPYRYAQDD